MQFIVPPNTEFVFQSWGWILQTQGIYSDSKSLRGNEVILLVDDEEMIRNLASAILTSYGYQVMLAENGECGFEIYSQHADSIDLVILDLMMPGWSGQETLRHLSRVNPNLRTLISSGYSPDSFSEEELQYVTGFLKKPYRTQQLVQAVRGCLDLEMTQSSDSDTELARR